MNALMLIFAIAFNGESGVMAMKFDTMAECEVARAKVLEAFTGPNNPSGMKANYVAAVCTTPIKVEAA